MSVFISSSSIPIGYTTPEFPSIFWPIGPTRQSYLNSYLYYSWDIWRFTVYWSLILSGSLYFCVGSLAMLSSIINNYRHKIPIQSFKIITFIFVFLFYIFIGLLKGFIGGAIIGVILAAIYQAGSLTMSCWIPLTWSIAQILYDIASSYSISSIIL
ncbi:uncharacterized protein KGF55_001481 [Candida pseudojiufengensis]|uniref:uncharacterized protein n=1 Tax=Candida pseudojiufengensis TaxID=497109 RepID=UPI002225150B|nr:uncharacterized protein KGF55_001481 [Candida pseudojiufengensis]KAI5965261.1 hypothetical protein KGF55_001481 [Candida pseudojiufengensis]